MGCTVYSNAGCEELTLPTLRRNYFKNNDKRQADYRFFIACRLFLCFAYYLSYPLLKDAVSNQLLN